MRRILVLGALLAVLAGGAFLLLRIAAPRPSGGRLLADRERPPELGREELDPAVVEDRDEPWRGPRVDLPVEIDIHPPVGRPSWTLTVSRGQDRFRESGEGAARLTLSGVPERRLRVTLLAEGYLGESRQIDVPPGGGGPLQLDLRALGTVCGTVTCPEGPLDGALVVLLAPRDVANGSPDRLHPRDLERGHFPSVMREERTAGGGRFCFTGVTPGTGYRLRAQHFSYAPGEERTIDVPPGGDVSAAVRLLKGLQIRGRVLDADGEPVPGITIHVSTLTRRRNLNDWDTEARAETAGDGSFRTPALIPGATKGLQAWWTDGGVQFLLAAHVESEAEHVDLGDLRPEPGKVRIELENRSAKPYVVTLVAEGGERHPGLLQSEMPLSPEGTLEVVGLPAGTVRYSVTYGDGSSMPSDFWEGEFQASGGNETVRIDVTPRPREVVSIGRVVVETLGGDPTARLVVARANDGGFVDVVGWERLRDDGGNATLRLPAGSYRLHLVTDDRTGSATVEVVGDAEQRVRVGLTEEARILRVRILDEGKPVWKARVSLRGFGGPGRRFECGLTDEEGRLEIPGIPPSAAAAEVAAIRPDGSGRGFHVEASDFDDAVLDLSAR